ncbi:MAG: hypothetical protein KF709_05435 [Gemmatimonadaceae bacterium]|nr:hypothetical protein [Gemmatimonadaceae bacterium]
MLFRPAALILLISLTPIAAQGQRRSTEPDLPRDMPEDMRPPVGKCRIWMEGVPPQQQPAPTDCQTALRQKPANGVVVFGPTRSRELEIRGFRTHPRPSRADSSARRVVIPMPTRRGSGTARDSAARDSAGRRVPTPSRDSARPAQRSKTPDRTPPVPQPSRTRTPPKPKPDSLTSSSLELGERQS